MIKEINWLTWLSKMIKEFVAESLAKPEFEIVEIYECAKTGYTKAIIKLSGRHIIERNISDIVIDNDFIEGLDKKTIRTLTYMATVERMKPDYSVMVQQMGDEIDDYILQIQSRKDRSIVKKSLSELLKDKLLISKFSAVDANRIGYLAGIKETVNEFQLKYQKR